MGAIHGWAGTPSSWLSSVLRAASSFTCADLRLFSRTCETYATLAATVIHTDRQFLAALRKTAPEAPETPKTATRRFFRAPGAVAVDRQAPKPCAARSSHSSPRAQQRSRRRTSASPRSRSSRTVLM